MTNIGVAAHISAASLHGPRYDPNSNSTERSSIMNGIWLCQSCAKLIDSDPTKYSKELLVNWKADAEKATAIELTKEKRQEISNEYDDVFKLMPALINEFITDIENNPIAREFILQGKGWVYNSGGRKLLVYYYEDHADLDAKIRLLENNYLVKNITYNNTKRYVLSERIVGILKNLNKYPVN